MMRALRRTLPVLVAMAVLAGVSCKSGTRHADSCESVVHALTQRLHPGIDEEELASVQRSLAESGNRDLPPKFVTKGQATKRGWRPGRDLWAGTGLRGRGLGGERFHNREGKLPDGKRRWGAGALDYQGGERGGKRLA